MDISTNHLYRFYPLLITTIVMHRMDSHSGALCNLTPNEFGPAGRAKSPESVFGSCASCGAVEYRNHVLVIWLCDSTPIPYPTNALGI